MTQSVTMAEFNKLLTKIVEVYDLALVATWESVAEQALKTDAVAQRDDALLSAFEAAMVSDNDILYSGYGWSGNDHYTFLWGKPYSPNAITFWEDDYAHDTYLVENNRLYIAEGSLIHMYLRGENAPVFTGNTYVQKPKSNIVYLCGQSSGVHSKEQMEKICRNILGDESAVVLVFSK